MTSYPFTPEVLDAIPEEFAELMRGLEDTLLEEICSRVQISGELNEVTVQDIRALRSHGIALEEIEEAIKRTAGITQERLDAMFDEVIKRNEAFYGEAADIADITMPEQMLDEEDILALINQTKGELSNITQSSGFLVRQNGTSVQMLDAAQSYQWVLDQAELQVQSGAISYNEAIANATKELADNGLRHIRYENNGRVRYDHADVAARRAVLTAVGQLCAQYSEAAAARLGTDDVEVSAHMGARDTGSGPANHAEWQGKLYSRGGKGKYPNFEKVTGYGTGEGLAGWNCRHSFYPFIEGVMERTYTDKQLKEMNKPPFEYQGKTYTQYEATQKQREIERTVRKLKRELAAFDAAGVSDKATATRARIRRLNAQYAEFSEASGLPMQKDRMKVTY